MAQTHRQGWPGKFNALDFFQWREYNFSDLCTSLALDFSKDLPLIAAAINNSRGKSWRFGAADADPSERSRASNELADRLISQIKRGATLSQLESRKVFAFIQQPCFATFWFTVQGLGGAAVRACLTLLFDKKTQK